MVAPAVEEVYGDVAYELRDVVFERILYLEEGRAPTVRVTMEGASSGKEAGRGVTIESGDDGPAGVEWRVHARMELLVVEEGWAERVDVEAIKGRCGEAVECGEEVYG
eukprot:2947137-Rhodomonas_salina.2